MTPPPVSGADYPTEVGAEVEANYLQGSLSTSAAYISNLYLYSPSGNAPSAETIFSVFPTIAYNATTTRQHMTLSYSPGFTFYQPSSELNEMDHAATFEYSYRLTEHMTVSARDRFEDSSTSFNPSAAGGSVSGRPEPFTPGVIPPFSKRLMNLANVELTMQTGPNTMIGGMGLATELRYPKLYSSNSRGGTGFYSRRISRSQYFGGNYEYLDMSSDLDSTQTQTLAGFYTFYPKPTLSLSVSVGPQHYRTAVSSLPMISSWGPFLSTSIGWQGTHTNLAASYSQGVTGGGGLLGGYHSRSVNATARWQMTRTWTASASGAYVVNKTINNTAAAFLITGEQGGHSLSATAMIEHPIGNQFSVAFIYDHINQSYNEIAAIAANWNWDREGITITWHFQRPLGK